MVGEFKCPSRRRSTYHVVARSRAEHSVISLITSVTSLIKILPGQPLSLQRCFVVHSGCNSTRAHSRFAPPTLLLRRLCDKVTFARKTEFFAEL